jgi:hypothetical protein
MHSSYAGDSESRDSGFTLRTRALRRSAGKAVVIAGYVIAIAGCAAGDTGCVNREIDRHLSTDSAREAVVYVRECGATTAPALNVSVLHRGSSLPDEAGNVLVLNDPAAMAAKRGDVVVTWKTARELHLLYDQGRGVSRALTSYDGTTVIHIMR